MIIEEKQTYILISKECFRLTTDLKLKVIIASSDLYLDFELLYQDIRFFLYFV